MGGGLIPRLRPRFLATEVAEFLKGVATTFDGAGVGVAVSGNSSLMM